MKISGFFSCSLSLGLSFLIVSCGGSKGGGVSGTQTGDNGNSENYSTIHYANGGNVSKNLFLSMYDDHKLLQVCNNGQSYYDDKCWDNINIDLDNLSLNVSNIDGTSEMIILNNQIDSKLYNATTSKFKDPSFFQRDILCIRATSEFVPDSLRMSRDLNLGTESSCWYSTSFDMPWPIHARYETVINTNIVKNLDIQTFLQYGDADSTGNHTHNWWLNGTVKIKGKILSLSSTVDDFEGVTGSTILTRYAKLSVNGYSIIFIFDKDSTNPYYSISSAYYDKIDQSQKLIMRPLIISLSKDNQE